MELPIFRHDGVTPGVLYLLRPGNYVIDVRSSERRTLPPGLYVYTGDPRTDDEIRIAAAELARQLEAIAPSH